MTKVEMVAFLDAQLEAIRQRGIAAPNAHIRHALRRDYKAITAIREALDRHVPGEQSAPPPQPSLF